MPEIILQHVTKRFDKFVAVQDLDLQIQDRGFITLLGPCLLYTSDAADD